MKQRQTIVWTILIIECVVIILTFFIMPFVLPIDPASYFFMSLLLGVILLQGWLYFPFWGPRIKMGKLLYRIGFDKTNISSLLGGIFLIIAILGLVKFLGSHDPRLSDFLMMIIYFPISFTYISNALVRLEIRENGFKGYFGFFHGIILFLTNGQVPKT